MEMVASIFNLYKKDGSLENIRHKAGAGSSQACAWLNQACAGSSQAGATSSHAGAGSSQTAIGTTKIKKNQAHCKQV